jgi:BirA family biotin operon repressor/biotin-[acetyl-CoA-carboxylase] ligase
LTAGPDAARVVRLPVVGSTNDEAMARLRETGSPVWVVADRQTGGRGRRGRPWSSEPGNLYASLAFPIAMPADAFAFLPLAAAVALADAIRSATGSSPSLKWPNDVLIDGGKVAGILIESESGGAAATRRAVAGFGVNVAHAPQDLRATHLAAHRPDVTANELFSHLAPAVALVLAELAAPGGVAALRARWRAAAVGIGAPVTVRFEDRMKDGLFVDLDEAGRLMLEENDGTVTRITAGDVFVRAETP